MKQTRSLRDHYRHADKIMLLISYGLTLYALGLAAWHNTWIEAFVIGVGTAVVLTIIYSLTKGELLCRVAMAVGTMVYTALHIHQAHGMIEMHFGIFALLAMLLYYRDWLPILVASAVTALHHISFYYLQAANSGVWVLDSTERGLLIIVLHAAYVVVEASLLIWFALNLKRETLQSLEVVDVTSNITNSEHIDLTQRTSGSTALLQRLDDYTSTVETLAKKVHNSADQLHSEGSTLVTITDKMHQSSQLQQRETELIATAIGQMSTATGEISQHAEAAASSSQEVDQNARKAAEVGHTTRDAVGQLADLVATATSIIEALNDQANSIGSVLDVIRGVAEQTNLLALNAAIEAARAGDQGRGFAVVADEVRTLAQRTQQSTEEIDQMIDRLQTGSRNAVDIIAQSRDSATSSLNNTNDSLALMEQVSQAIEQINKMNTMIATAATEQISSVSEVNNHLNNIVEAGQQGAQDARQAANSSNTLHQIAEQLTAQTKRFRISSD